MPPGDGSGDSWTMSVIAATLSAMVPRFSTLDLACTWPLSPEALASL